MQHDEFIGHVQQRARLASRGDAERATQAVLQTLAERLAGGAAENLASELPAHLAGYVMQGELGGEPQSMTVDEFLHRVAEREGVDLPKAVFHVRAVLEVLGEAVSEGQMRKIRAQLPEEWDPLFESGSEGEMDLRM
ncbi:MAG: DUF2267 domain-containing protein [Firmicutes bacterium]|mgnify:FL=1|nr:DUF2267 domain-containing protein [Bacillota bacterium]